MSNVLGVIMQKTMFQRAQVSWTT